MRFRGWPAAAALVGLLVAAGCGNQAPSTSNVKAPLSGQGRVPASTVCGMYSETDASTALGVTVQPRTKTIRGDQCIDRGPSAAQLLVTIVGPDDATRALAMAHKAARSEAVSGLGDEAVWALYLGQLVVRQGDRGLIIQLFSVKVAGAQARDHAVALAREILPKLK